jgi:hypothetical protein
VTDIPILRRLLREPAPVAEAVPEPRRSDRVRLRENVHQELAPITDPVVPRVLKPLGESDINDPWYDEEQQFPRQLVTAEL